MHVLSYKWARIILLMVFVLIFSVLVTTFSSKFDHHDDQLPEPSIKCGECPCLNPCSQQPPPPPPLQPPPPPPPENQDCGPPPPSPIYVAAGNIPPPPPRFTYVTGAPGNYLYPTDDPFSLMVYSNAARDHLLINNIGVLLLVVCSAIQLLVF